MSVATMRLNRIGNTSVWLSAVGFGTCQLQMVPEEQAVETLLCGFALGVNWVHADLGYGGVETIVAKAIRQSRRTDVIPVVNGWGNLERMEEAYERSCAAYGKRRLEVFGLSCVDDDDLILKHDVWGPNGMVARLRSMKREGRIDATWCSTHGNPDYVARLIECGAFDAIMLAYNPLGSHALTFDARQEGKDFENIPENARRIFPLAVKHNVSLLIMKPLAGGMLVPGKAFRQRKRFSREAQPLRAQDVLRSILQMPGVAAVVPGTCSQEEAEENARAGHEPIALAEEAQVTVLRTAAVMRADLCSRCGECEPTCSKSLPISWMFREAYMWSYFADIFDAIDRHHYFRIHPSTTLTCTTCDDQTCLCPSGLDIPKALAEAHAQVVEMRRRGQMHPPPAEAESNTVRGHVSARALLIEVPPSFVSGEKGVCQIWLENVGEAPWVPTSGPPDGRRLYLRAAAGAYPLAECNLRLRVEPRERVFFAFHLYAPRRAGTYAVSFELVTPTSDKRPEESTTICKRDLRVEA
jgi:predicted aldo/keto reductase-like oxidoreductase